MPAYMVYICQEVLDRAGLERYWSLIGPTLEGFGARPIAAYTRFELLEGDAVDGVAVIEFPSMARAREWYESDAYRAIRHHRQEAARYIGVLAEGGNAPPDERMPHTKGRERP
jgi:uncharacterized protein (DUF1330 family)